MRLSSNARSRKEAQSECRRPISIFDELESSQTNNFLSFVLYIVWYCINIGTLCENATLPFFQLPTFPERRQAAN